MLKGFENYLKEQKLCKAGDRILLAVSGGIDSVVMAHLFHSAGYDCAVAHCNFQLRGEDSEGDEAFVRELAGYLEMPVFVKRFDVDRVIQNKGISVQMAARELRYEWFSELLSEEAMDLVATAHNKNDSVETFFLNLSRGSGIRGLKGIASRREKIIRPMLFVTRQEIETYRQEQGIQYREDASNFETKYLRNKIRHDVIPVMEQINPGFIESMSRSMIQLGEIYEIYRDSIEQKRSALFEEHSELIIIDARKLGELHPLKTWLFELFSPFGFSRSQCEDIEKIMEAGPGSRSISPSHQLYKDREHLILIPSQPNSFDRYYLDGPDKHSALPFSLDIKVMEREELGPIPKDPMCACLDLDEIQFPLTIRHWVHGDYFYPLGMNQMKKLSDYFVDNKIPVPEKESTWIMASGKKIVWIMGQRIDHRFRITPDTRKVLLLRLQTDVGP
ncbi:MAG: tRNA lysidine(34) synthetase TilS [Bacteroidia bacterium]|nr:MAG: tRNA lysidine(34) synthetase TilS [Bacteroidia bacterium]